MFECSHVTSTTLKCYYRGHVVVTRNPRQPNIISPCLALGNVELQEGEWVRLQQVLCFVSLQSYTTSSHKWELYIYVLACHKNNLFTLTGDGQSSMSEWNLSGSIWFVINYIIILWSAIFCCISDTRNVAEYYLDHITLARAAKKEAGKDFRIPFDVHLPTTDRCIVYDSKTVSIIENSEYGYNISNQYYVVVLLLWAMGCCSPSSPVC